MFFLCTWFGVTIFYQIDCRYDDARAASQTGPLSGYHDVYYNNFTSN